MARSTSVPAISTRSSRPPAVTGQDADRAAGGRRQEHRAQRQSTTGRPPEGSSRTMVSRRPFDTARPLQASPNAAVAVVSTAASTSPVFLDRACQAEPL